MAASIATCPAKMWTISLLMALPRRLIVSSCIQYRQDSYAIKPIPGNHYVQKCLVQNCDCGSGTQNPAWLQPYGCHAKIRFLANNAWPNNINQNHICNQDTSKPIPGKKYK